MMTPQMAPAAPMQFTRRQLREFKRQAMANKHRAIGLNGKRAVERRLRQLAKRQEAA